MQEVLNSISDVGGVRGTALFDAQGSCVAHMLRPPYEPILISEAFGELRSAMDYYTGLGIGDDVQTSVVRFDQGIVAHRGVGTWHLMALCDNSANLAMLSVAFNVARLKIERGGSSSTGAGNSRAAGLQGPASADTSMRMSNQLDRNLHEHGVSGPDESRSLPHRDAEMSWSSGSKSAPAGAIGLKVMRHLLETFMRYVGNEARPILETQLREMGATPRSLSSEQFADLIRCAARKVHPPHVRKRFVAEVLGDGRRR